LLSPDPEVTAAEVTAALAGLATAFITHPAMVEVAVTAAGRTAHRAMVGVILRVVIRPEVTPAAEAIPVVGTAKSVVM
jgi:hypothetical protein